MSIERVAAGLETVGEILGRPQSDPDAERQDWGLHSETLQTLITTVNEEVLAPLDEGLAQLDDDSEQRTQIRAVVADRVGDAAGLLFAAGRDRDARAMLEAACRIAEPGAVANLSAAGLADSLRFTRVIRAWWLVNHDRREEAAKLAQSVLQGAPAAIVESAQQIVDHARPLASPPSLFGINGFGLRVYGERDRRDNGTYVTTRYITAVFIPLLPLDAFRVARGEGGEGWYFLAKDKLSTVAVWWRRLALLGLLVAVAWGGISAYFNSVGYRMGEAMEAAEQAEAEPEQLADAVDRYEAIIVEFADEGPGTLEPAVAGFVRASAATVVSPLTAEHVTQAKRVALRYRALPDVARHSSVVEPMLTQLEAWVDELGDAGPKAIAASLDLLGQAEAIAPRQHGPHLKDRRHALNRTLAAGLADQWPLEAIRQYVSMPQDPEALTAAAALLDGLGDGPSVWIELAPTVERWQAAAQQRPELHASRSEALRRVAAAREVMEDEQRQALLEKPNVEALVAAVAQAPGDQELVVALADLRLVEGDAPGAIEALQTIGPPGRMVLAAQAGLASAYADNAQEAEADELLERVLSSRLPAFESARRTFGERVDSISDELVARAQRGQLPPKVLQSLQGKPEAQQQKIFSDWHDAEIEANEELAGLREEYSSLAGVVGVAIQWGTIKLRRANKVQGQERQQFLDGAERAFLSIGSEGAGIPSYHLGLGQVYYRLGKPEQGESEFGSLLEAGPDEVRLAVASVYRELGEMARAREVAEQVFNAAEPAWKQRAAVLMALMSADRDEARTWLERGDTQSPMVRLRLVEYEGDELLEQGDYAGADAKFAEVAAGWAEESEHSSAASNNAALAIMNRYRCTGDVKRLKEAVRTLEHARSLEPDSALVVGNLASAVEMLAQVELLDDFVQVGMLRGDASDLQDLVGALIGGPRQDEVRQALKVSQPVRRTVELLRQQQVLGPSRPESYSSLLRWHRRHRDVSSLEEMGRILTTVEIDLSDSKAAAARYIDGSDDESHVENMDQRLRHYETVVAGLGARARPSTRAAIRYLHADMKRTRADFRRDPAELREAIELYASAQAQWDALSGLKQASALVTVAILDAGSEALTQAHEQHSRRLGLDGLLARLLEEDGAALAALRARPEVAQAVALRQGLPADQLRAFDWLLGRVASDSALTTAAAAALSRPVVRMGYDLDAQLSTTPDGLELVLGQLDAAR